MPDAVHGPQWPQDPPGPEARWRGERGEQGPPGAPMTAGARHAVITLVILIFAISAAALFIGAREVSSVHAQQAALRTQQVKLARALAAEHARTLQRCKFDADLGSAPIAVNPATGKASLLGVSIVSDARVEWHGVGCPGKLAPGEPSFVHWAKVFKLPYR